MKKGNTWVVLYVLFVCFYYLLLLLLLLFVICDSNVLIGPQFRAFRLGPEGPWWGGAVGARRGRYGCEKKNV